MTGGLNKNLSEALFAVMPVPIEPEKEIILTAVPPEITEKVLSAVIEPESSTDRGPGLHSSLS
jgi:hypothetical protein